MIVIMLTLFAMPSAATASVPQGRIERHKARVNRHPPALFQDENYIVNVGRDIPDHRRNRGSCGTESESENEQRVKHNVDDGTNDGSNKRGIGKAFRPQSVVRNERKNHERSAQSNVEIVIPGVRTGFFGDTKQRENGSLERSHQNGHKNSKQNRAPVDKRTDLLRPVKIHLTEKAGNH